MDEQSLVSYCVMLSVVLPVNTVIVAAVAAICWRYVLSVLLCPCVSSLPLLILLISS